MTARRAAAVGMAVAASHALIAGAICSVRLSYGTVGAERMFDDVLVYYTYASRAVGGEIPYRDFAVEYPALAFPFFVVPRFFTSSFSVYKFLFAIEMFVADAVMLGLLAWQVGRERGSKVLAARLAWFTACLATLCPLAVCRFDLLAAAWGFAAASAWVAGRPEVGGVLAGTGVLVKIAPGVVALPALADRSVSSADRLRGLAALTLTLAVGGLVWVGVGGPHVARSFGYHLERGVEIGSVYAGGLIAAAQACRAPLAWEYRHKSLEILTPWSDTVAKLGLPVQAAALLVVAWRARAAATRGRDPWRDATAALLAFVAFGKVLSPQYLLWLLPFVGRLDGRAGTWARGVCLLTACLTTLLYPGVFHWLLAFRGWAVSLLIFRNGLLIGLWGLLTFGPRASASGPDARRRPRLVAARTGHAALT